MDVPGVTSGAPMLDVADLDVTYAGATGDVSALHDVNLRICRGESVAVIGPSGCGKTTLLLAIAGLVAVGSGTITVSGTSISRPRRETALILQDFGLLPWKRVHDNTGLGLVLRGLSRRVARRQAMSALEHVGVADFARSYPGELSGGMKQRVALARALALDADLLLMDEPLASLDAMTRETLQNYLLDLWRQRAHTQVIVTHSIEEAAFLGQRVLVMSPRPGRISAVVDNPGMGSADYRASGEFYSLCSRLRGELARQGPVLGAGNSAAVTG